MDLVDKILGGGIPYITYAVPFFFLLIGLEVLVARWEHKRYYRFNDSINDLSCGILQTVTGVFTGVLLLAAYVAVWNRFALIDMQALSARGKWIAALALFLGVDCCYYWFHRLSHQMNAPWAAHAVHHQSEEYNLAVALRQGTFQPFFSWVFYLPLAVIGFPPLWYVAMSSFDTLYQFWIHTRLIGRLGPLEWIFNTPSHHRVHHGRNLKYLDKNHAGTLIIWDRMFGTFQAEEEEPVYGIVRPLASWNPLWANFHEYVDLWHEARQAPYWLDKFKIWFMPPGWQPRGLPERPPTPDAQAQFVTKYHTRMRPGVALYVLLNFVGTLVLAVLLMKAGRSQPIWLSGSAAALVLWGLVNYGAIFEHKRFALWAEPLRWLATLALAGLVWQQRPEQVSGAGLIALAGAAVVMGAWLMAYRQEFAPEVARAATILPENLTPLPAAATGESVPAEDSAGNIVPVTA